MATAHGSIDLGDIATEDFNSDLELRVLALHGEQVLGSAVVKPSADRRLTFEVAFDPVINPGAFFPCSLRLIVGPNVSDRALMSLDTASTTYEFTKPGGTETQSSKPRASKASEVATDESDAEPSERAERAAVEAASLSIDVGTIEVAPHIYHCWRWCCRIYRIRGKVVCRHWNFDSNARRWRWCDDPVPGAEVDIYDVERFFWWYREGLITTVTTQFDGTFEAKFVWCCPQDPWWDIDWRIDNEILNHITGLLAERNIIIPPPVPDPDPFVVQGLVAQLMTRSVTGRGAAATAALTGGQAVSSSAETLRALLPPSAKLASLRVWPWSDWDDCQPDVIFRVRQRCNGTEVLIHDEGPDQTRWDIPTNLDVTLLANDKACCLPRCHNPECPDCLKLTWIGCSIPIDHIADGSALSVLDLRGYKDISSKADEPLYDNLQVRGDIGTDIDYFKVQYSKDGGVWTDLPAPQFAGYSRRYWQGAPGFSPYIPFVPVAKPYGIGVTDVIMTRHHYEQLNPGVPRFGGDVLWDDWDTLFYFNSDAAPSLGDGLFEMRFLGYQADGADSLVAGSESLIRTCGLATPETVFLRIDNQLSPHHPALDHVCGGITSHLCVDEPEAYIRNLVKNEGLVGETPVSVCDIIDMQPTDTLTIHFTVSVPANTRDGHLGGYEMWADYGASDRFYIGLAAEGAPCPAAGSGAYRGTFKADPPDPAVQVGPSYADALGQGAPRPHWYGGNFKVTLRGCDFPVCCAYDIYLHGWKRTTDGCQVPQWTHWNQYHNTFTILRRDLCPDICA